MPKPRFLPSDLREDIMTFIVTHGPQITFTYTVNVSVSTDFTDSRLLRVFEEVGYWMRQPSAFEGFKISLKDYEKISNEIADFLLLEELNKGLENAKTNSSN